MLPLILLPGMGGDARMFRPQLAALANATVPAWIEPQRGEGLAAFAARMARAVDPGGACFVGGSSFGGMVAVEMARHLAARACFLIGSIRSPREFPLRIRFLRPWLGRVAGLGAGLRQGPPPDDPPSLGPRHPVHARTTRRHRSAVSPRQGRPKASR